MRQEIGFLILRPNGSKGKVPLIFNLFTFPFLWSWQHCLMQMQLETTFSMNASEDFEISLSDCCFKKTWPFIPYTSQANVLGAENQLLIIKIALFFRTCCQKCLMLRFLQRTALVPQHVVCCQTPIQKLCFLSLTVLCKCISRHTTSKVFTLNYRPTKKQQISLNPSVLQSLIFGVLCESMLEIQTTCALRIQKVLISLVLGESLKIYISYLSIFTL